MPVIIYSSIKLVRVSTSLSTLIVLGGVMIMQEATTVMKKNILFELNQYVWKAQHKISNVIHDNHNDFVIVDNVKLSREEAQRIYSLCLRLSFCSEIEQKKYDIQEEMELAKFKNCFGKGISNFKLLISLVFPKKVDLIPNKLSKRVLFWNEFKRIINDILVA